jgi:hypothetical protein
MPKQILKSNSAFVGIGNPLSTPKTIQRSNLFINSEAPSLWGTSNGTPAQDSSISITPNFTSINNRILATTAEPNAGYSIRTPSVQPAGVYTFSIYVKYVNAPWIRLQPSVPLNQNSWNVVFNVQNGTLGTSTVATVTNSPGSIVTNPFIIPAGNGWYRIGATITTPVSNNIVLSLVSATTSSGGARGSNMIYGLWGVQLERGAFLTNYIKTTTATVTVTEVIDELRLFTLTQNCNFGVSNDHLKLKQIGFDGYAVNEVFQAPKVNLTLDYLHSPYLNNELLLGFNGTGDIYQNALSGFNSKRNNFYLVVDNREFKEGFDEVKRIDPLNIDFSGFSIFSFGDCYLTNYSLNFQIGQIPSVSTTFACSNMKIDTLVDSQRFEIVTGSFTWNNARLDAESKGGRLAILNTEEKQNKVPEYSQNVLWIGANDTGVEGTWRWIDGTLLDDGYTNWKAGEPNGSTTDYARRYNASNNYQWDDANDLSSSANGYIIEYGIAETKNQIDIPSITRQGILNLADSYFTLASGFVIDNPEGKTEFNVPVTSPMHSDFILDDLQVGGIKLESYNKPLLQSLSIDIDLSRNDLYGLGSDYVYDRKINYPINAKIDMSVLVSGVDDGFISGILQNQQVYGFTINCINTKNYITGSYKFNNCRLNNFNYSMPLNNVMTFNASFDCTIRNDAGFLMRRVINTIGNYYQDFDTIWNNLSINWESV